MVPSPDNPTFNDFPKTDAERDASIFRYRIEHSQEDQTIGPNDIMRYAKHQFEVLLSDIKTKRDPTPAKDDPRTKYLDLLQRAKLGGARGNESCATMKSKDWKSR